MGKKRIKLSSSASASMSQFSNNFQQSLSQEIFRAQNAEKLLREAVAAVGAAVDDNSDAISYEALRAVERETALAKDISRKISGHTVLWGAESDIDNFVAPGCYIINGEHLNIDDGLPIPNAGPGRTVAATLIVVDSTASNGCRCITQMLLLSDRAGAAGNLHIRTATGDASGLSWGVWGSMLSTVDVGQVGSLDSFTDSGIYSGIYFSDSSIETFMMVVINNSVAAGSINTMSSVSQFKYALALDGSVSLKKRSGGVGFLGGWRDIDAPLGGYSEERPSPPSLGTCFFDSSLGKPVWWSGSSWVDAAGEVV